MEADARREQEILARAGHKARRSNEQTAQIDLPFAVESEPSSRR
jgi:hypothetical protein